jgi:hypothetical protein
LNYDTVAWDSSIQSQLYQINNAPSISGFTPPPAPSPAPIYSVRQMISGSRISVTGLTSLILRFQTFGPGYYIDYVNIGYKSLCGTSYDSSYIYNSAYLTKQKIKLI